MTKPLDDRLAALAEPEADLLGPKPRKWVDDREEWQRIDRDYRRSLTWRRKWQAVMARDQWLCQSCRMQEATIVHHKHYRNWREEPLEDLQALCAYCHAFQHGRKRA
jgi:hypothetical protein